MSDGRINELLNVAADRYLSDEEQAELEHLLQASPEAGRRLRSEFEHIDATLRNIPNVALPQALHEQIMARVALPMVKPTTRSPQASSWWGSLNPFIALRYGMAAAAGLVLAAVFYESRGISGPADLTELVGSMAPKGERGAADVLDTYAFRADGIDCLLSLERRNGMLLLNIDVGADTPVDISVDLASAGVRLEALAQMEDSLESIETDGRILRMRAQGRRQLTALLQPAGDSAQGEGPMNLEFSVKGRLLQRGSLTPAW
jgi:anti-sigma factor RsiW